MPDLIHHMLELPVPMKDLYEWLEDPAVGAIMAPAKEVVEVNRNKNGRVESFKTNRGTVQYVLHDYPQRWVAEYHWRGYRADYDVRLQSFGDPWTRLIVDCNIQPQSFMGRLFGTRTWERVKGYLNRRLEALQKHFNPRPD